MHAKSYITIEVSISCRSKVIANVKNDNRQTDRQDKQTNKQTGQKQYATDHTIWGHKNTNKRAFEVLQDEHTL